MQKFNTARCGHHLPRARRQSDLPRRLIAATSIPAVAPVSTPRPGPSTRTAMPAPISAPCANSLTFRASAVDAVVAIKAAATTCRHDRTCKFQQRSFIQSPLVWQLVRAGTQQDKARANGSTRHFADNVSATASSITPASSAFLSSLQPSASSAMNLSRSLALSASELAYFEISISRL